MYMCIRTNAAQRSGVGFLRRDFRASWTTSTVLPAKTRRTKEKVRKGSQLSRTLSYLCTLSKGVVFSLGQIAHLLLDVLFSLNYVLVSVVTRPKKG